MMLLILLAPWSLVSATSPVTSTERAALVDLYLSTGGADWGSQSGWQRYTTATVDPCVNNWFGVTCSGTSPNHIR